jgi:energy-coupling factor transport system ATP-binding protein
MTINLENLSFQYPGSDHWVLKNISLNIPPGSLTLVTGASGSGKSTFLRCFNGLVPHFSGGIISGKINVHGFDPIKDGPKAMASKVGFVFQEPESQFVYQKVEDEIAFVLENLGIPRHRMGQQVDSVLSAMGLSHIRTRKIENISGGEKQLVAIASALVARPRLLILDEPTSQLDPIAAGRVLDHLLSIKNEMGLTVLISEHRLERLLGYADQIAFLADGGVLHFGAPAEILPEMDQVPPVVRISQKLALTPYPLTVDAIDQQQLQASFPTESFLENQITKPPTADELPGEFSGEFSDELSGELSGESSPAIKLAGFSVQQGETTIIQDLNFQLQKGEILTLMGPNGAGKTTLLRAILGLIPAKGDRVLFGRDMAELTISDIIEDVAYLPQDPNDLLFAETVREELEITLKNHGLPINPDRLSQFLSEFDLAQKENAYPRDLSVGERQRTALAAITVHQPRVIFLDEPTRGMDYRNKESLARTLKTWRQAGVAILLVTHDTEFAATLSDRVAVLEEGQCIFYGSPQVVFTKFPQYRTQTATLFPAMNWIVPDDIP